MFHVRPPPTTINVSTLLTTTAIGCFCVLGLLCGNTVVSAQSLPYSSSTSSEENITFHRNEFGDVLTQLVVATAPTVVRRGVYGRNVPKALQRILEDSELIPSQHLLGNVTGEATPRRLLAVTWTRGQRQARWGFGGLMTHAPAGVHVVTPAMPRAALWRRLSSALGSLTSTGLHNVVAPRRETEPRHSQGALIASGTWQHALLVDEAVCAENFAPWLLMQPCNGATGWAAALGTTRVLAAAYHSFGITVERVAGGGVRVVYTLDMVETAAAFRPVPLSPRRRCPMLSRGVVSLGGLDGEASTVSSDVIPVLDRRQLQQREDRSEVSCGPVEGDLLHGSRIVYRVTNPSNNTVPDKELHMAFPRRLVRPYTHTLRCHPSAACGGVVVTDGALETVNVHVPLRSVRGGVTVVAMDVQLVPQHWEGYHPDANRLVFVPPALVLRDGDGHSEVVAASAPCGVMLPVPDFSMPFNVLTLGMTSLVLMFGSLVSVLAYNRF
eukprot:PhM_4_TR4081/c0_g1_i1/m.35156/K05292/PIGT; phosphatidylinositol glycan, class T